MNNKLEKFVFEYEFVPMMVSSANDDPRIEPMLTTKQVWKRIFDNAGYETVNFTFDDIAVDRYVISPNVSIILYTFPEIDRDGLAKYGIVVIDTHVRNTYRYFTMEKPYSNGMNIADNLWFVVEQKSENRFNHNTHTINNWQEFVQIVIDICYNGQIGVHLQEAPLFMDSKVSKGVVQSGFSMQHEGLSRDSSHPETEEANSGSNNRSSKLGGWLKNLFK